MHPIRVAGLISLLALPAFAGIVTNGSFEGAGDGQGIPAWTATIGGGTSGGPVSEDCNGMPPSHSGLCHAALGHLGTLDQVLPTMPGQQYLLSFWFYGNLNPLSVLWGDVGAGADVGDFFDGMSLVYTLHSIIVTANGASADLAFSGINAIGTIFIDDVDVTAVPEPSTLWLISLGAIGLALNCWCVPCQHFSKHPSAANATPSVSASRTGKRLTHAER